MERVVFEKSKNFALRIIALYKYFCDEKREFILSKQLLRSGTSIGANIAEANCACSRKDFLAKMHIAFKESAETAYWLELLYKAQYLTQTQYDSINADCGELQKLLSSITKSLLAVMSAAYTKDISALIRKLGAALTASSNAEASSPMIFQRMT